MIFEHYLENKTIFEGVSALNEYDQKNFQNNLLFYKEGGLDKMLPVVLVKNGDVQVDMIEQSMESLKNHAADCRELSSFYESIYDSPDIDDVPLSTKVYNMGMIDKIRPQYLDIFVQDIGFTIDKFLNGRMSKSEIENIYMVDYYLINCKKQMVRTSIPYELDAKDLPKYQSSAIMQINQDFITGNILPFLRSIPQIVKDLSITSANVTTYIEKSYENIQVYITVAERLLKEGKIDIDTYRFLNKFLYKMIRTFMSLSSYLTFIMIKKISAASLNMQSYVELQNDILRYFPDGKDIMHENVLDGSFSDMDMATMVHDVLMNDNSMFRSAVNTIVSREEENIINIVGRVNGTTDPAVLDLILNKMDYNLTPYKNAINIFKLISDGFKHIHVSIKNPNSSCDEIIDESGLNDNILSRFSSYINNISELHQYDEVMGGTDDENKRNAIYMIFREIKDGVKNTDNLVNAIYNSYNDYLDLKKEILSVNPDDDRNKETATDVLDFLHDFDSDFRQLVLNVLNAFISRFKSLAQYIDSIDDKLFPNYDLSLVCQEDGSDPLDDLLLESELTLHDIDNKYRFHEYMLEYRKARTYYETGMRLVYEAETQQQNTTGGTGGKNMKQRWEDLKNAIRNLFGKSKKIINDIIEKQMSKNLPLLQAAKEPLSKLNYTGTVINVVPYEKYSSPDQMLGDIDKLIGNINKLNKDNIRKYNSQKNLNQYLFSFMTDNAASSDDFGKVMGTYYKTKTQPLQTVAYRGNAAQAHVQVMCDYCINFYQDFGKKLNSKTDALQKALDDKITTLETMVESVVYEEGEQAQPVPQPAAKPQATITTTTTNTNQQNNNAKPSVQKPQTTASVSNNNRGVQTDKVFDIMRMLSTSVQQYITGVTRAARDRNFDYLKVLNPLIPQDIKDKFKSGGVQEQQPADHQNSSNNNQQT